MNSTMTDIDVLRSELSLQSPVPVQRKALEQLASTPCSTQSMVPELLCLLEKGVPIVQCYAAKALGVNGKNLPQVGSALEYASRSSNKTLSESATWALARLSCSSDEEVISRINRRKLRAQRICSIAQVYQLAIV